MSSDFVHDPETPSQSPAKSTVSDGSPRDSARSISEEDLANKLINIKKDGGTAIIDKMLQGRNATLIYIDSRSGGSYFSGSAHVVGDVVGGDQVTRMVNPAMREFSKEATGRISSAVVDKICSVYILPQLYSQAQRILSEKHILLLWGDSHFGKRTSAIHLLSTLYRNSMFEVNPALEIEMLRTFEFETKTGYVIDTFGNAGELNGFILNNLSRKLREKSAHLIITIDKSIRIAKEAFSTYAVEWNDIPDPLALLEKHLTWYLSNRTLVTEGYALSQEEAVREILNNRPLPGDIDSLAALLAKVVNKDLSLEEALARFSALAQQQVEDWFEAHKEVNQRIFMIALATLNGSNYQAVVDASHRLRLLIPQSDKESENDNVTVSGSVRSQRLKEVCAHLTQGYKFAEYGRVPIELIKMDNPAFQPAVLSYVWNELDQLRTLLLEWLFELGLHTKSNFEVSSRVAAAVGKLSTYNFDLVLEKVLCRWALNEDQDVRALTAIALGVPALEDILAPQVLKLLHHWSTVDNVFLQWTAAVAYGGYVGLRFPDTALQNLLTIVQSENLELLMQVYNSVISLFQAGEDKHEYYFMVLDALHLWTDAKSKVTTLFGLIIFLALMREAKTKPLSDPDDIEYPTILWLAKKDEIYRSKIANLLRRSLKLKPTRKLALEALHDWLEFVDDDHRLYDTLGKIIFVLIAHGTSREKERMFTYLSRWASSERLNAAGKILSVIKKRLSI